MESPSSAHAPRPGLASNLVRAILFFLLAIALGPLIGGLGFYVLLMLKAVGSLDPATTFPQNDLPSTLWAIVVFSYVLGLIPAAIAALPLAVVVGWTGTVGWRSSVVAALAAAAVAFFVLFGWTGSDVVLQRIWLYLTLALPSLLAALSCLAVAGWLGLTRPATGRQGISG